MSPEYLSDQALAARRSHSTILPPLPEAYAHPDYQSGDSYFGGQPVQALYADLAPDIPPRYVSPLTVAAQIAVSVVLSRAVDSVREHNPPPPQLEGQCAAWLNEMDKGLRERLAHGRLGGNTE